MKKLLKCAFVAMFATAVMCAISMDANASGVEGGPGSQTIVSKVPPCPNCGSEAAVKSTIADTGEIVYMCWDCKIIFGYN
ncbi:MAG: hypothetical protein E7138_06900 [Rikenellaceae bacterium]|nr:hypothetical protein [Rikenellaceae bacterium]